MFLDFDPLKPEGQSQSEGNGGPAHHGHSQNQLGCSSGFSRNERNQNCVEESDYEQNTGDKLMLFHGVLFPVSPAATLFYRYWVALTEKTPAFPGNPAWPGSPSEAVPPEPVPASPPAPP